MKKSIKESRIEGRFRVWGPGFGVLGPEMTYLTVNKNDMKNMAGRESRWVKVGQGNDFLPEYILNHE
jgi:hypothetical protein